jgi:hypothetical protein
MGEGVVDEDVESALFALDLVEQGCDVFVVGMVDSNGDTLPATAIDFGSGLSDRPR